MNGSNEKFDWIQKPLYRAKTARYYEWELGYLYDEEDKDNEIFLVTQYSVQNNKPIQPVRVLRRTLCKYSGVEDKNHIQIFEGDILSHFGDLVVVVNDEATEVGGIRNPPRGFICYYLDGSYPVYPLEYFVCGDTEEIQTVVIGNIYDGIDRMFLRG